MIPSPFALIRPIASPEATPADVTSPAGAHRYGFATALRAALSPTHAGVAGGTDDTGEDARVRSTAVNRPEKDDDRDADSVVAGARRHGDLGDLDRGRRTVVRPPSSGATEPIGGAASPRGLGEQRDEVAGLAPGAADDGFGRYGGYLVGGPAAVSGPPLPQLERVSGGGARDTARRSGMETRRTSTFSKSSLLSADASSLLRGRVESGEGGSASLSRPIAGGDPRPDPRPASDPHDYTTRAGYRPADDGHGFGGRSPVRSDGLRPGLGERGLGGSPTRAEIDRATGSLTEGSAVRPNGGRPGEGVAEVLADAGLRLSNRRFEDRRKVATSPIRADRIARSQTARPPTRIARAGDDLSVGASFVVGSRPAAVGVGRRGAKPDDRLAARVSEDGATGGGHVPPASTGLEPVRERGDAQPGVAPRPVSDPSIQARVRDIWETWRGRFATADSATVRVTDEAGSRARIHVVVRGDEVRTMIMHDDAATAHRLTTRTDELHDSLRRRGFGESHLSIHNVASRTATELSALHGARRVPQGSELGDLYHGVSRHAEESDDSSRRGMQGRHARDERQQHHPHDRSRRERGR